LTHSRDRLLGRRELPLHNAPRVPFSVGGAGGCPRAFGER